MTITFFSSGTVNGAGFRLSWLMRPRENIVSLQNGIPGVTGRGIFSLVSIVQGGINVYSANLVFISCRLVNNTAKV